MIKANELRIGNYVTTIDDKITCTSVKGFYGFPVSTGIINHNNNVNDFEYLNPIFTNQINLEDCNQLIHLENI